MKKILIIGATSLIAEHCARIWATRGSKLFLVGRDTSKLNTIASDLTVRGATQVSTFCMDFNDLDKHISMLNKADTKLNGIELVLIAYGTLSNQTLCENDVNLTISEINTNAISIISLLTHIANRFEVNRAGKIAIISSVSGEKGRASNYVYGCAKAMVTTFASGLRQRLHKSNVSVLTLKPGYVDTPMTAHKKKGVLWAKPAKAAKIIIKAIDADKDERYVPGFWWLILTIIKLMPTRLYKKIRL